MKPLVEIRGLTKEFPLGRGVFQGRRSTLRAVDDIDLEIFPGECLSIVGESGSGKTTLGRCMIRLIEPTAGSVSFAGEELTTLRPRELRARRKAFQMVFQDPYGSLNPRMTIGRALAEPLEIHAIVPKQERDREVARLLERVGLPTSAAERYPHEFSGGQRQRVGIARALAPRPQLIIADEPVSALDVSVQAQILNLLIDLQSELGLTVLFIAHDLAVVEQISHRVGVLYQGRLVEVGSAERIFGSPQHPYTHRLLQSVPVPDPARKPARRDEFGDIERSAILPSGCAFHPRCPIVRSECRTDRPELQTVGSDRQVACHDPEGWAS